jgi:prepilin-type N-terminal cleavage/methylation domain-containing protein
LSLWGDLGKMNLRKYNNGLTLIEVMISVLIALVIVTAVMGYMYTSALNARAADIRATATRLGLLVMEAWKSDGVSLDLFDPAQLSSPDILVDTDNDIVPSGGMTGTSPPLGTPMIKINGVSYFVKLTYDSDDPALLRKMEVLVAWNPDDYGQNSNSGLGDRPDSIVLHDFAIY